MNTTIKNGTTKRFELKEGNAGAYRYVKSLDAGAEVSITVDVNATYREYMVATGNKGELIILTSDDFSEYEVHSIFEDPGPPIRYKSRPSKPRDKGEGSSAAPELSHAGTAAGVERGPPGPAVAGDSSASSLTRGVQEEPGVLAGADIGPKTKIKAVFKKIFFRK